MKNEFVLAISQLSAEKNLDSDTVFQAVEAAMASALKKDDLQYADIAVKINRDSGDIDAWRLYTVTPDDDIEDDEIQVSPERAAKIGYPGKRAGDVIREEIPAAPAGRIAAQTLKQVVLQRLREAERESVFEDFTGKEGELVSGTVLRVEGGRRQVILDLGRTEAVLPAAEQVRSEHYRVGQRLRVYVKEVYKASKGPQVVVSRSNPALVKRLFELEVPEIARGVVEVMGIARDGGHRTKIAVISRQHGIDPIGACVGLRGSRIQNIVNELGGERIDVIRWDPSEEAFVANALSPAEVVSIRLDRDTNTAYIAVPDKQLSLAIGKEGQNARLAAQLTGRRIDIRGESAVIAAGDDLYPPPEPNMEAIPIPGRAAATATAAPPPEAIAPSQALYTRPGLPGERAVQAPRPAERRAEEIRLTPEQEVMAEFVEEEPETVAPAAEVTTPAPARPRTPTQPGGLRFGEDIRDLVVDEEEEERRRGAAAGRRGSRGGRGGPVAPVRSTRPQPPLRGGGRRVLDEFDEEEIEAALHGDDLISDEDGYEDDQ
ncbi:MAG: transcription termination/antitermination protein NusA [Dehalococcoidia bacterium]|nr:MAG: transcription termination/antitermination protein NusA [Dehalococcoidia bacterium]